MTTGRITVLIAIAVFVAGCSDVRESIIPSKRAPDEFAVYTRAPLNLPPEYNLRVPAPGIERPQSVSPRDIVEEAVLGSTSRVTEIDDGPLKNVSPGLQVLLDETGASTATSDIRAIINQETSILAEEDASVLERMMFWGVSTEYGSSVDAAEEKKRIQENQALGQPLDSGEVPTIAKKRKGILEGIFD